MVNSLHSGLWGALGSVGAVKTTDEIIVNTRQDSDVVNTFVATATPTQLVEAGLVEPIASLEVDNLTVNVRTDTAILNVTGVTTLDAALTGGLEATAGVVSSYPLSAVGKELIDDFTVADQRTTLGLGNLSILDQVDSIDIVDGAVIASKIDSLAVTTPKLDDDAVTTIKITDLNVTEPKLSTALADKINGAVQDNHIFVNQKSDLPTPAAGVIQLADDVTYEFKSGLTDLVTDRLEYGQNTVITGQGSLATRINYDGVGSAITCSNKFGVLDGLNISCASGNAIEATGNTTQGLIVNDVASDTSVNIGKFTNFSSVKINNSSFDSSTDGIGFIGTGVEFSFENSKISNVTNTSIDFGAAVITDVDIINCKLPTGVGSTGISATTSTNIGNWGRVIGCLFSTTGAPLSGFDQGDAKWWFANNINVQNSQVLGGLVMELNATATVINVVGQWEKVAGTTITSGVNERVTMSGNNELTMDTNGHSFSGILHVSLSSDDDASIEFYEFTVFKNGTKMTNITMQLAAENFDHTASLTVPDLFTDGDVYELYLRNMTNLDALIVNSLQIMIKAG
jgi:hypothetical protein